MRVSARLAKKLSPFNSLKLPLPIVSSIANYLNRACLKIKAFIKEKKPKNSTLRINPLKHNYGFAILGVLIVSGIGLIITSGVVKQYAHMQTQIQQAERSIQRTHVMRLIENHMSIPGHCKKTLNQVASDVSDGTNTELTQILSTHGDPLIELGLSQEELRSQYGVEGLTLLQLQCEETGGVQPCKKCSACNCPSVKWSLSLISQSYINGLPSFNRIVQVPLKLTHTGPDDSDFECGYTANGGQVQQGSICDCPAHRPYWTGSQCLPCPGGKVSDGTLPRKNATCVCPSNTPQWNGSQCVACPSNTPQWNGSQCVACPSNTPKWDGSQCVTCPSNKPQWNGSQCVACPTGQNWNGTQCVTPTSTCTGGRIKQGSNCVCPSSAPNWNGSQCVSSIPTCSGGQVRQGNSCVCPSSTPNWDGSNCVACSTGTTWNGASCITPNPNPNPNPNLCSPPKSPIQDSNGVIKCVCPNGSNWNGFTCVGCQLGSSWIGGNCVPDPNRNSCSGGRQVNSNSICTCPSNTVWDGAKCVSTSPDPNCGANQNKQGNTCACIPGYKRNHYNNCEKITNCPRGYSMAGYSDGICRKITCKGGQYWTQFGCKCPTGSTWEPSGSGKCLFKGSCTGGRIKQGFNCVCPSGKVWDGSNCVTSLPTCTGGRTWDSNLSQCACPSGKTWSGSNCVTSSSCNYGRFWNGSQCVCPSGKTWSGSSCVTPTLTCTGGRIKQGSSCVCPSGKTWSGSSCVTPTPTCTGGRTWNGSSCVCPSGKAWVSSQCLTIITSPPARPNYSCPTGKNWVLRNGLTGYYWTCTTSP